MDLTLPEKEKVTRLIEEGVVRSTDKLGKMSRTEWGVMSSSTNEVPAVRVLAWFRKSREPHMAVLFRSGDEVPLEIVILFSERSAQAITDAVTKPFAARTKEIPQLKAFTIGEVSNVLCQSVVGVLADEFGASIILSVPEVHEGPKAEMLGKALDDYDGREDVLLMSHVEMFSEELSADCSMVIIVNAEILRNLIRESAER